MTAENEETPSQVIEFLKTHNIPDGKKFVSYLYRRKKDPKELKLRSFYLEKMENQFYDDDFGEDYIKDKYGGGRYQIIIRWQTGKNEKTGMALEDIYIDGPEKETNSGPVRQDDPPSNPVWPSSKQDKSIEEKIKEWIPIITSAVTLVREIIPKQDTTIIDKLQDQYMKKIDAVDREILSLKKRKLEKLENEIELEESEAEQMQAQIESIYPEWLKPYAPLIEQFGEKLLGNSFLANTLKKTVAGSEVFKNNWADPNKRAEAIEAMSLHLGPEIGSALEQTFNEYMERKK